MRREQGTACKLDALPQEIYSRGRLDSDSDGYWEMRNIRCKLKEREAQAGIKKELVLKRTVKHWRRLAGGVVPPAWSPG